MVPGVFEDEVGHEITLTPGEVAGFALSSLWSALWSYYPGSLVWQRSRRL